MSSSEQDTVVLIAVVVTALTLLFMAGAYVRSIRVARLKDSGMRTFGRVVSSTRRVVHNSNSTTTFQDLAVDVAIRGRLVRGRTSVRAMQPVTLGVYPLLVVPHEPNNMRLKLR